MSFIERMQDSLGDLSEAKKRVAYYLMDNWLEAAFLSAAKVARNTDVSESVVVRFSQDIGYSGFPELQKEIQEILKSRLVNRDPMESNEVEPMTNQHPELQKVYDLSLGNLNEVLAKNTIEAFNEVLTDIIQAKRIVILARKNSLGPAHILNVHINEVFSKSQVINGESVEALDIIRGLSAEDIVINIAIPSYSKRIRQFSDYLCERGIPQIAITNTFSNPFAKNAKCTLVTSVNSLSYSNSHLGTVFIIDVLIYLLTLESKGDLVRKLEEINTLNERFGIIFDG